MRLSAAIKSIDPAIMEMRMTIFCGRVSMEVYVLRTISKLIELWRDQFD
jgi:hypothetical protein